MGKKSKPSGSKDVERLNKWLMKRGYGRAKKWGKRQEKMEDFEFDKWRRNKGALKGIADQQIRRAQTAGDIGEDYLQQVQDYDTPERRASESAKAQVEVASQMDAARNNALRRLESYGVDPSQTRNAALDSGVRVEEAKAKALAGNTARRNIENRGMALKQGVHGQQGQMLNEWDVPRGMDTGQIFGDAVGQATQGAGALLKQGQQEQAQEQQQGSQIGTLAGAGIGAMFGMPTVGASVGSMLGGIAEGGEIEGPGGPKDDAIPANLSDGEFVIPEEVVRRKGTEFFDKLIEKVKTENAEREAKAQHFNDAMAVPPPEAIPPEGMPNSPQGIPPGMNLGGEARNRQRLSYAYGGEVKYPPPPNMYKGGEVLAVPYPGGGETGQRDHMGAYGMYKGGEMRKRYAIGGPVERMDYPPPPNSVVRSY